MDPNAPPPPPADPLLAPTPRFEAVRMMTIESINQRMAELAAEMGKANDANDSARGDVLETLYGEVSQTAV